MSSLLLVMGKCCVLIVGKCPGLIVLYCKVCCMRESHYCWPWKLMNMAMGSVLLVVDEKND